MAAKLVQSMQPCSWMNSETMITKPNGFIRISQRTREREGLNLCFSLQTNKTTSASANCGQFALLKVSSSLKDSQGSVVETGAFPSALDESLVLKDKSTRIRKYLNGRCIYLVGMMGSGKTTIGKLLAEVLDYSFFDSDSLVETLEGISVAEIFNQHGEGFFREKETKVLEQVSTEHSLVISTGGGAVIRPINWRHMHTGVSVWLDVPIDCLARRISAVGTGSRPLLHGEGADAYTKAYTRLSELFEKRHKAYENASARVSFEQIAAKRGNVDVDSLTPNTIAIEVLEQIERFLRDKDSAI